MSVEHGGVASQAASVSQFVYLQPPFTRDLPTAHLRAHTFREDLCTSARKTPQPRLLQVQQDLFLAHTGRGGKMGYLRDGERLQVDARCKGVKVYNHSPHFLIGKIRVLPTYNMQLGHAVVQRFRRLLQNLFRPQGEGALLPYIPGEGTEVTPVPADVSVIDMPVAVEIDAVAHDTLPLAVRQMSNTHQVRGFEEGAFTLRPEEILEKASEALDYGVTELHIVGGEHPDLPYEEVRRMIVDLHAFAPGVHLKAFTVSEIAHFAASTGMGEEEVLLDLKEAGLGSLPGGGAEIFAERVRSQVCSRKISGERWLEIHKLAHRCGLRSNATMLYGHVDSPEDRVDHLIRLREAQDETGGFQAFIPLVFHPANTKLSHIAPPTGVEILKMVALSRLMLDNFLHIKSYWIQTGIKLAQISLFFGANDVDGTVVEETITRMAGSDSGVAVSREELVRIIEDAGRVPVERDTLYRPLRRYGA